MPVYPHRAGILPVMRISLIPEQARPSDLAVAGRAVYAPIPDFELTVTRRPGGSRVIAVSGELDLYRAPAFEQALAEAVESDTSSEGTRVVVDLREVTFLDTTTLALLLA